MVLFFVEQMYPWACMSESERERMRAEEHEAEP